MLIGTGMDLSVLNPFDPANPEGLLVAAFLLVMAIGGKVAAGWSYLRKDLTNCLVVGPGMMPRGQVGLIFLAPILLRLVIPTEPSVTDQPPANQPG